MARNTTRGTMQLGIEVDQELRDRYQEFVRSRGETMRTAIERAMQRDMTYPAPVPPPAPLPDAAPPAKKRRGRPPKAG